MARKRSIGGKAPQTGMKVSHSHIRTKRKWMPNIQSKNLYSEAMGTSVRVTITTQALRSVDRAGGLDLYLMKQDPAELTGTMRKLRAQIAKRLEA